MGLLVSRNPLVYPGGRPGFNPQHFIMQTVNKASAGQVIRGSIVATGSSYMRVDSGSGPPTVSGAFTGVIDPIIGPSINQVTTGATKFQQLVIGSVLANSIGWTWGAIFCCLNTNGGARQLFFGEGGGSYTGFSILNSTIGLADTNSFFSSTMAMTVGVPYFVGASCNTGGVGSMVLANLANGQITTLSIGGWTSGSGTNNTTVIAFGDGGARTFCGNFAAGVVLRTLSTLPQLLKWAAAPWDFWYPPTARNLLFSGIAGPSSLQSAAIRRTRVAPGTRIGSRQVTR